MATTRTVAVTGAAGFVGRHVVAELLDRGHHVVALVRDAKAAGRVLPGTGAGGRLRLVEGDVLGEGVCEELLARADACCHLIGIIREGGAGRTFRRAHVRATERVVEACEGRGGALGAPFRFVHMSALGVGGESAAAYRRTKFEAEGIVRASALAWTIMRPGLIHGPGGEFVTRAAAWARGRAMPWVFLPVFARPRADGKRIGPIPVEPETAWVAPVHVGDVAWAFAEALERRGAVGEVYHLVGSERLRMGEVMERVRDAAPLGKRSMPVVPIPARLAAAKARAAGVLGMGRLLPFDEGMALMAGEDAVAPLDKARAQLGFAPRAFSPSLRGYAARL